MQALSGNALSGNNALVAGSYFPALVQYKTPGVSAFELDIIL